jgi:hypothetical protein
MLKTIEPRFVTNVPRSLEPGVLYVSMEFGTTVHACCCGCGEQVVTPLAPNDWSLLYDGQTVSLWPSIGNWNMHCRSHYVIQRNEVVWLRERDVIDLRGLNPDRSSISGRRSHWLAKLMRPIREPKAK